MRNTTYLLVLLVFMGCVEKKEAKPFTSVRVETIFEDSLSIRAIELMDNSLAFAADKGTFGNMI